MSKSRMISRRSLRRGTFKPLVEKMESRQLLAAMTTWTVDPHYTFDAAHHRSPTIQQAVDAAHAGDRINVHAGNYHEDVLVNKKLDIEGSGKANVDPVDDNTAAPGVSNGTPAYGFNLQANDIVIKNFHIGPLSGDTNTDPDGSVGINTSSGFSGYKIQSNTLENNVFGIYLNTATGTGVHQTLVQGNTIQNNNFSASSATPLPAAGNGIYSDQGAQNVLIKDNKFHGHTNEDVIFVGNAGTQSGITVQHNSLQNSSGIFFINVQNSTIRDNDINGAAYNGIELAGGNTNVQVTNNNLRNIGLHPDANGFFYGTAIFLNDAYGVGPNTNNIIQNNRIDSAGKVGIRIEDSDHNILKNNDVKNTKGLDLSDPAFGNGISLVRSTNNTVDHNNVEKSARDGIYVDSASTGNTISNNNSRNNAQVDKTGYDYFDGTGGTGNTYTKNAGKTQNVPGLISKK